MKNIYFNFFFKTQNCTYLEIFFYSMFSVIIFSLLISAIYYLFYCMYINQNDLLKLEEKVKRNKILLILTILFSIPNKILINNKKPIISAVTIVICFWLSNYFIFFLLAIYYSLILLSSLIFGLLIEKNKNFRKRLSVLVFCNCDKFAFDYIDYFFGNPSTAAKNVIYTVVVPLLACTLSAIF